MANDIDICVTKIAAHLKHEAATDASRAGLRAPKTPSVRLDNRARHRFRFFAHSSDMATSIVRTLERLGIAHDRCFCRADNRGMSTGLWIIRGRLSKRFVRSMLASVPSHPY